ncbi:unnamed protein product [Leptidea sinapis]|uniref:Uncharacterized protein n=1 Tax=Leptidea sinapis TaxID=189913 RepID=A0A5E4QV72_9NEOP|nr:unnamed protein product [Leptidea sinapis]
MAVVYSNILRDHQFDAMCKAEISFLIPRLILNGRCELERCSPNRAVTIASGKPSLSPNHPSGDNLAAVHRQRH